MDAQVRSEEKFSKISISYEGKEEAELVCTTIDKITSKYPIKPESYTCRISNKKDVVVLEYQDDVDRMAGKVFEEIIKTLNITICD
jgi:regulation of enolase protein 1 (concanavalin A-like superfamily)